MTTEERLLRLENAFATLVELAQNTDARIDRINEAQARTEANLEALTVIVSEIGRKVGTLTDNVEALTVNVEALTNTVGTLADKLNGTADA
jgi:archaellum component FlaC